MFGHKHIVTCCSDYWWDFDWMIGFIALIHSSRNYKWYSAIADLHILQFTVTHALGFSVFTNRILATDFITLIVTAAHMKSTFHSPVPFFITALPILIAISSQSFNCHLKRFSQLYLSWPGILVLQSPDGPNRKHRFHLYSSTIPRLLLAYSLQRGPVYRVVAQQWTSTLAPLFRISGVVSQYTSTCWTDARLQ
jgi:hypothetical protein